MTPSDTTLSDTPRLTPRIVLGLGIMGFGLVLGLDNLGLIDAGTILRLWPLLLVVVGIAKIVRLGRMVAGLAWIAIGGLLTLHNLGLIDAWRLWPFALVLAGAHIVYRAVACDGRRGRRRPERGHGLGGDVGISDVRHEPDERELEPELERIDVVAILGGVQRTVRTPRFRGGTAVAIMGGCELDLRGSSIAEPEAVIDVTAFWGGLEIRVPEQWRVESRGIALLGGFADKTHAPLHGGQRLVITGIAVMGGVEVKN